MVNPDLVDALTIVVISGLVLNHVVLGGFILLDIVILIAGLLIFMDNDDGMG